MLISTPNLSNGNEGFALTPTMIRGAFLLWRFELQRGQFAEIRHLDRPAAPNGLSSRASAHNSSTDCQLPSGDTAGGRDALQYSFGQ
jgi:hypothetical protein